MELINKTIKDCFEERVRKTPKGIFMRYREEVFSWECVNNITNKTAAILTEQGVKKGDMVGLMGINSASWVVTFLALQKIGAETVLINSHYKEKELGECIRIAKIKYLFFTELLEDKAELVSEIRNDARLRNLKIFDVEKSYEEWYALSKREIKVKHTIFEKIDAKDVATVLFTSGTTNKCKGVQLSHYAVVNNAREVVEQMRWNEKDKICLTVPLFHCFGVTVSLLTSIIAGMEMVILKKYRTVNVCESIERYKCTVLNGVPSMFLAMIRNKKIDDYDVSTLKSGIIAGSPIYPEDYLRVCEKLKPIKLQTSYGLTEASPCVTISDYGDSINKKSVSAGKVINNVDVKIINLDTQEECVTGEWGEIFIRGYNITSGYLSCDAIVCDAIRKDGWLRTGDLGYLDENGYLYMVGRRKNLIIRGGENISPNEIEDYIKEAVKGVEVRVLGVKSEVIQEEIVACIKGKEDADLVEEIKKYLKQNLSKYKIPKYFVFLERFPKNPTGKVDEKKLREAVENKIFDKNRLKLNKQSNLVLK